LRDESPYGPNSQQIKGKHHHQHGGRDQQQRLNPGTRLNRRPQDSERRAEQGMRNEFGAQKRGDRRERSGMTLALGGQSVVSTGDRARQQAALDRSARRATRKQTSSQPGNEQSHRR
jgi:hypothetical protein